MNTAFLRDAVWLEAGIIAVLLVIIAYLSAAMRSAIGLLNRPGPATRTAEQRSGRDRRIATERRHQTP